MNEITCTPWFVPLFFLVTPLLMVAVLILASRSQWCCMICSWISDTVKISCLAIGRCFYVEAAPTLPRPKISYDEKGFPIRTIICPNPNCGHRGEAVRKEKTEGHECLMIAVVLLTGGIALPFVLIYYAIVGGRRCSYNCPNCGMMAFEDDR